MKNKILALTLGTILALSSTTAFAADLNTMNFNFSEILKNYNTDCNKTYAAFTQPTAKAPTSESIKFDYTVQQPANQANTTIIEKTEKTAQPLQTQEPAETAQVETQQVAPSAKVSYEERVAQLVNIEREKNGLKPLVFDASISNVARAKSKDMADNNYFAHQSPRYGSAGDMLRNFGINWSAWGENIASGQRTPEVVVNAWMNSEGHRANILSPNFGKIGVGYVTNGNGTPYWTQMFTN